MHEFSNLPNSVADYYKMKKKENEEEAANTDGNKDSKKSKD